MEEMTRAYINLSLNEKINYYEFYKNKYCNEFNYAIKDDLKERLIKLRKDRAYEMNIPAYYVFTNDELEKLVEIRPRSIDELRNANILSAIKIKTHGDKIIEEIIK